MNTALFAFALKALNGIMENMPEELKRSIDKEIDKWEDKEKDGSLKDAGIEAGCKVLRGLIKVPDYPDVPEI